MRDSAAVPDLPRRRLLGAAAGVALAGASAAVRAYPGAKAPAERPVLPPAAQQAIAATGLPESAFGLYAQALERRKPPLPLIAHNADQPFQLASTAKLVTSLAALDLLGPQFRWRTQAFLTGPILDGRLLGDLIIVGGGDARLSAEDLRAWFAQMQQQGLREVLGDIVLDRFAFRLRDEDHAGTPLPGPDRPHHARPDALLIDEGVLRVGLQVQPDRPGVSLTPAMAGLRVLNEVAAGRGCAATVNIDQKGGEPRLVVRGQWASACGSREIAQLALPPEEFAPRAVGALWREAGGRLRGRVLGPRMPERDTLYPRADDGTLLEPWSMHTSAPLAEALREMNKASDNLAARNLMLSLAQGFPMQPATLPQARERVQAWLRSQGLRDGDVEVDTGAGLSRAERGKPRALAALLQRAWAGRHARLFIDSLPLAGIDGTLQGRMAQSPATGRAHLKTGTLLDTRALAGYVDARSGRSYAVALIANHPEAPRATPALDAIVEWLVTQG